MQTDAVLSVPLWRYRLNQDWERTARSLASPAPDGSVAYYLDVLSPVIVRDYDDGPPMPFNSALAAAACRYVQARAIKAGLEPADGPYLQILEDDGAVPNGWVMLRAMCWVEEFDLVVPVDKELRTVDR